jgi:hypothetical protein
MNRNIKYCSVFLLFALVLLLASSISFAADVNDTGTSDNTITSSVDDNAQRIITTDNNDNTLSDEKQQVSYDKIDKKAPSDKKELTKEDKNLKASMSAGTVTATPNNGKAGDKIALHIYASSLTALTTSYTYKVTVKLNDTTFYTGSKKATSTRNGDVDVTVPDYEPGTYTLYMEWNYNNGFRGASGSTQFTIIKTIINTKITQLGTVNGDVGNTVIPVNVTDSNGNAITGQSTLTFKDGETVLLDNVPITNGTTTVNVPTNRLGEYPITVIFNGNDDYYPSNSTVNVNVSQAESVLILDDTEGEINTTINALYNTVITGTLQSTSGAGIRNQNITVKVNNTEYNVTTDENGKFEYKYPVTEVVENIPISVKFDGNELYSPTPEISGKFNVKTIVLTLKLDDVELSEVNETTTISGSVTDEANNMVANTPVNLTISGVNGIIPVNTDTEGKFTYDIEFKEAQDVTVTASKDSENGIYQVENTTTTFTVVVGPRRTNLTVNVGEGTDKTIKFTNVTPYHTIVITNGTLIDIFKEAVNNAEITVLINNQTIPTTTDENGNFQVIYNATEGRTTYDISVKFEGNEAYKPAGEQYTGTFTTRALNMTVTLDDNLNAEYLIGENATISGMATFEDGIYSNQELLVKIDGTNYPVTTDADGKFSYTYTTVRNGSIPVTTATNNDQVALTSNSINMNVVKPLVSVVLDDIDEMKVLVEHDFTGRLFINSNQTGVSGDITIKINGDSQTVTTDENGLFTYSYTPTIVGLNNISVSFNSNQYTTTFNDSKTFNVLQLKSRLIGEDSPLAVKTSEDFKVSGQLVDENNNAIPNAEVKVIINDETFTTQTDNDGVYSYIYDIKKVGENNLYEVRYSGNASYDLARNYVGSFFDVEAGRIIVSVNATDCIIGSQSLINGTLLDENDAIMANEPVVIIINSEEITVNTNDDGIFEYNYTPTKAGKIKIIATYNQTLAKAETIFTVNKSDTTIVINPIKTLADKETSIIANITNEEGNPVTGGKVAFKLNGKTMKDESGKVIYAAVEDGKASIIYTFTIKDIYSNITAVYSGCTNYNASRSEAIQVEIEEPEEQEEEPQLTGEATVTVENVTATPGETVTLTATIKDGQTNIDEGKVVFKIAGKTLKDEKGKAIYVKVEDGIASLTYTIPTTYKAKEYTLKASYMSSIYDKAEGNATLTVVKTRSGNSNNNGLTANNNGLKTDSETVHIVTNDNVDEYIKANGLTSLVSPGDTLDIQGLIDRTHSLVINKPINIISSTQDAVINLHTVAGSLMGEDPGNCFVVNKAGAGSNISSLYLNNTECWIFNTHDVTLHNMTMHVKDARVGSGVGQTAIRYSERITIDSCYIYTENNGGSTSMALTGTSHVLIKNTTIEGQYGSGQVGNILYIGNRNNIGDKPSDFTLGVDTNVTVIDSTLIGDCRGAITVLIYYGSATNTTFINNTINTTGSYGYLDTGSNGIAIGNKLYQGSQLIARANSQVYNNIFYGTGSLTAYGNSNIYNNTINKIELDGVNVLVENNTINTLATSTSASYMANNSMVRNNNIIGNVDLKGPSRTRFISNVTLMNNNIGGTVTLSYVTNTNIIGNTMTKTLTVPSTATNTYIANNTINTTANYAVVVQVASTTVTENYLVSAVGIGDFSVSDTTRQAKIYDNGPYETLIINMDNYFEYFPNEIFNGTLPDKGHIVLEGEFNNVRMVFDKGVHVVEGLDENTKLNDVIIVVQGSAKISIKNLDMTISDSNSFERIAIQVDSNYNNVKNVTITTEDACTMDLTAIKVTGNYNNITDNTIDIESSDSNTVAVFTDGAENIQITRNYITVNGGFAIRSVNSKNVMIHDNYLNTTEGKNNYAVIYDNNCVNIIVENNTPERNTVEIEGIITGIILEENDIVINLTDVEDGSVISDGTAYILINDEFLTDEDGNILIFNVEDGKISLNDYIIPSGWLRSDANMTIIYSGTSRYQDAVITLDMDVSKRDATVEILTEDITASVGESVILQARITDNDELVTSGRVAFKLNGASLSDEDDNLISVDVIDGIATLEFVIPTYLFDDTYTLTAVFENQLYNRSVGESTFTITE